MRQMILCLCVCSVLAGPAASYAAPAHCSNGKSTDAAMWYSVAHPGLGEWYLKDWGSFNAQCTQKKFWLGFIPGYGWPGYLQVKSAVDARNCRTNDDLSRRRETRRARN